MKKFILPIIFFSIIVFFLPPEANAQTREECDKTRARASYNCLTGWTKCYYPCVDQTKDVKACGDTCTQAEDACDKQVNADYKTCLAAIPKSKTDSPATTVKEDTKPDASETKKETPKQSQNTQNSNKFKLPVFVGEWFRTLSDWISLGEFAIGLKEAASNLTIADDAIIEDEKEQKEWDQYYESYNSLKSQGLTHEQIEATLQKPRKRDVSMSLQELDALKAKLPAGESITNVAGTTNTKLYSWEADSGALIKSTNWERIEFKQPVVDGDMTTRTVKFEEGEMEVKVRNNNPAINRFAVDANGFFDLFVIQTHFWIDYDPAKKLAIVGVYEGQVEIKTKNGKTIKVAPDGDPSTSSGQGKPRVVIISRKLSPVRLALAGLVLAAIAGGVFWFVKGRKLNSSRRR